MPKTATETPYADVSTGTTDIMHPDNPDELERVLGYLLLHPRIPVDGIEVARACRTTSVARRVRELRSRFGWPIYSGVTFHQMIEEAAEAAAIEEISDIAHVLKFRPEEIKLDQYVLMSIKNDGHAAYRWYVVKNLRKEKNALTEKILDFFRQCVGEQITAEELKHLARHRSGWARRVRELRTEHGWPIVTRNSGRADLPIGVYMLEQDRQSYPHDRAIPDPVRLAVLQRDGFKCVRCGWNRAMLSPDDPRKMLELHHVKHHKDKGANTADNLITLCNVDHDTLHRNESLPPTRTPS